MLIMGALVCFFSVTAKSIELPGDLRTEQIYISPERTSYQVGDTIKVTGVVTSASRDGLKPYSRYLYLELINPMDSVVVRQKLPCHDSGRFNAEIPIELMGSGTYNLRCYTRLMRNFSPLSFAFQPLWIGDRKSIGRKGVKCHIAANTGGLRTGWLQKVIGVIEDTDGVPLQGRCVNLLSTEEDTIGTGITSPSGFCSFDFIPQQGKTYELAVDEYRFPIAEAETDNAPMITGVIKGNRVHYTIANETKPADSMKLYFYDRLNGLSMFRPTNISGTIAFEFAPQVVTVFLTDSADNLLGEFSGLNQFSDQPVVKADEVVAAGAPVPYKIAEGYLPDSAMLIARLIAIDEVLSRPAEAMLNYMADFSSPLQFPARLAISDNRQRASDIQAWLSTAKFKRFNVKEALADPEEIYGYLPEFAMEICGVVKDQAKRPIKNGRMVAFDAWSLMPFDAEINRDGTFAVKTDDFADGTEFFMQWHNKKDKPENARIELADAAFPRVAIDRHVNDATYYTDYGTKIGITENVHQLGDIVVRAPVVMQNRFESKAFYGIRAKSREKIEERGFVTLLDILRDLPTLTVAKSNLDNPDQGGNGPGGEPSVGDMIAKGQSNNGTQWVIRTHRGASTLGGNGDYVPLYVDGNLYEPEMYDVMFSWPASDIESVEFLTPAESLVFTSNCLNGVVSVKTRSSNFISRNKKVEAKGVIVSPPGLSIAKGPSETLTAPTTPGDYILQVDIISPTSVNSVGKRIKVQ